MKYFTSIIILISLVTSLKSFASEDLVVVVSKDSAINSLNEIEIANIFLARTRYYPNGEKSMPIELKHSKFRDEFYQIIAGKNTKQLMAYWTTLVFTGKGRPPKTYTELDSLLEKLSTQKNHITYLNINLVTDDMKIVYRFPSRL